MITDHLAKLTRKAQHMAPGPRARAARRPCELPRILARGPRQRQALHLLGRRARAAGLRLSAWSAAAGGDCAGGGLMLSAPAFDGG